MQTVNHTTLEGQRSRRVRRRSIPELHGMVTVKFLGKNRTKKPQRAKTFIQN